MGGMLWLLALVWAAGGSVQACAQFSSRSSDPSQLNSSYVEMVEAMDMRRASNLDVIAMFGLHFLGAKAVFTQSNSTSSLFVAREAVADYLRVKRRGCVPPETWTGTHSQGTETHSEGKCLTEEQMRRILAREIMFSVYNMAAILTETLTKTRIQFYLENSEDLVVLLADLLRKEYKKWLDVVTVPLLMVMDSLSKFRDVLKLRYTKGRGNSEDLIKPADFVHSVGVTFLVTFTKMVSVSFRAFNTTSENFIPFQEMFRHNFEKIVSRALPYNRDSSFPYVTRYWNSRAIEYGVFWLFRLETVARKNSVKVNILLVDILKKLEAGEIKSAINITKNALVEYKDNADQVDEVPDPVMGHLLPEGMLDMNMLEVPTAVTDKMAYEKFVYNYMKDFGDKYIAMLLHRVDKSSQNSKDPE